MWYVYHKSRARARTKVVRSKHIIQPTCFGAYSSSCFIGMDSMCHRHGSNQNSHPPVLVRKPLCNQFIYYHISSRGVFGINHFKLRNFSVVTIEYSFATVDGGSIRARIYWWTVMIYGSLQAEFMETKCNSHINEYGTSSFGTIVVNISKSINNNTYEIEYFIVIVL